MDFNTLIDHSKPVLVAVSGGADSVALLAMLVEAGFSCHAAHCNFHLRGDESLRDERHVVEVCRRLDVPLHRIDFQTADVARQRGISIEMAARDLRYAWFQSLLDELNIPVVAVAHHADDAAETFLLNLSRGTGLRGLTGMKPRVGNVVRPLLDLSRLQLEDFCHSRNLDFVIDSSNNSDDFARNRIRHHVVPTLKAINPAFLDTMRLNTSHLAAVYSIFLRQLQDVRQQTVVSNADGSKSIAIAPLLAQPDAEPFLFEFLSDDGFPPAVAHDILRSICQHRSGATFFSHSHRAVVDRDCILVQPLEAVRSVQLSADSVFLIDASDAEVFSPLHLALRTLNVDGDFVLSRSPRVAHLDASKLQFPLALRRWRQGDVFRPLGLKGSKKLSDFFIDVKLSQPDKENVWVLESDGSIVWVVGLRIDDRFKFTDATSSVLELKLL